MKIQFVLMSDPDVLFLENGDSLARLTAFMVATDEHVEYFPVVLTALGEAAELLANYGRCGSLVTLTIGSAPEDKRVLVEQMAKEYRWDWRLDGNSKSLFVEEAHIEIPADSEDIDQEPPSQLTDLI